MILDQFSSRIVLIQIVLMSIEVLQAEAEEHGRKQDHEHEEQEGTHHVSTSGWMTTPGSAVSGFEGGSGTAGTPVAAALETSSSTVLGL